MMRFTTSADGTSIAVNIEGDATKPVMLGVWPWAQAVLHDEGGPAWHYRDYLRDRRLSVGFDRRGTGDSQRDVTDVSTERALEDLEAVASTVAAERFDIFAAFDGAPVAIAFAAKHPERMNRMVLWQPMVVGTAWLAPERADSIVALARSDWTLALRTLANIWVPRGPVEAQRRLARSWKTRLTPEAFALYFDELWRVDVRDRARNVRCDTLIVHPEGAGLPPELARSAASLIPGAQFYAVPSETSFPSSLATGELIVGFFETGEIVAPSRPRSAEVAAPAHGTAVILFTDIVDSTALTERLGDAAFRDASRALDASMRGAMREAGGTPVEGKVLGDGVMAVFQSAAQAIDAARRCVALSAATDLRLHVGIHAGDVIRESDNVYGGAVNIAARICGLCEPGEILVSATIRDLARTSSGVTFADRGEHALKGIEDAVRVFAVQGG